MSEDAAQDKPPVFSKWSGWYWLLAIVTVIQFIVYYFITRSFS